MQAAGHSRVLQGNEGAAAGEGAAPDEGEGEGEEEDDDFDMGDEGVDVNEKDGNSCTPLHVAIASGHVDCAEALLSAGAKTHITCDGCPPLHRAICTGNTPDERSLDQQQQHQLT